MSEDEKEDFKTRLELLETRLSSLESVIKTYGKIILIAALFNSPMIEKLLGLVK